MAGGFGKRIADLFSDVPKPMINIDNKPILQYQIENLKRCGIDEIIIVVHHLKETIIDFFGDGSRFGVKMEYFEEDKPLGTAGALFKIKDKLSDNFLLINGDLVFDIDFNKMIEYHTSKDALATVFVHPNSHPYDSDLIICGDNNVILDWRRNDGKGIYRNQVNAGIHIIAKKVLSMLNIKGKASLREDVLSPLLPTDRIFAYNSSEYVKDMGTVERYKQVCADVESGIVSARCSDKKQKAVFLDRDGTINKYKGYITSPRQLELIDGASDAIKMINRSGYLAVVVTNQPSIAMGRMSFSVLEEIHAKLDTLLGEDGAYLDAIYFCPHHPDAGFSGEIQSLKIKCDCRKPSDGLLRKAAEDFNIDLSKSFMVGDSESDILAGQSAGCKTAFLLCGEQNETALNVKKYNNLKEFAEEEIEQC
jgi:D,D-heptose 1,7-bisphosphate phosphatase